MKSQLGKCETEAIKFGLKRSVSGDSQTQSSILVSSTWNKNLSSQFFDLDIENPLGGGTFVSLEPSM
jgi:hypothetical protein